MFFQSKKKSGYSDLHLILNYKKNNNFVALEELFSRYCHLVFSVCYKYLQHEEESKDAVMEIFEKLAYSIRNTDIQDFKSWLYTVIKNHCLMKQRKKKIALVYTNADEIMENSQFENLLIMDGFTETDIQCAIHRLTKSQQLCTQLFYFEKKSYKEISIITKIDLKKVKSHLQNSKRNLKNILTQIMDEKNV